LCIFGLAGILSQAFLSDAFQAHAQLCVHSLNLTASQEAPITTHRPTLNPIMPVARSEGCSGLSAAWLNSAAEILMPRLAFGPRSSMQAPGLLSRESIMKNPINQRRIQNAS
jgi:hypothetical protein